MLIPDDKYPMNTWSISFPYSYAAEAVDLNWCDVLTAIENGYLPHESAKEHAIWQMVKFDEYPKAVFDLVCLTPAEIIHPHSIHPFIDELASETPDEMKSMTPLKLMYVVLKWVHEHQDQFEDPLTAVEIVYADFGHPREVAGFIRYMPIEPGSRIIGTDPVRLYKNWSTYLETQGAFYRAMKASKYQELEMSETV